MGAMEFPMLWALPMPFTKPKVLPVVTFLLSFIYCCACFCIFISV